LDIENQKYQVALDEELIGREDKIKHNINRAYTLATQLGNVVKEAREKSEVRRGEMVHMIKQMVPDLNIQTENLISELEDKEYMELDPTPENLILIKEKLEKDSKLLNTIDAREL
jgi:GTP cyclohydrolase II